MDDPVNDKDLAWAGAGKAQAQDHAAAGADRQSVQHDDPILPPASPPQGVSAHANNPAVADDSDLIEREWVDSAREIVGKTRGNPYQRSNELTKLKADYLKKRYNKDIKLTEE